MLRCELRIGELSGEWMFVVDSDQKVGERSSLPVRCARPPTPARPDSDFIYLDSSPAGLISNSESLGWAHFILGSLQVRFRISGKRDVLSLLSGNSGYQLPGRSSRYLE